MKGDVQLLAQLLCVLQPDVDSQATARRLIGFYGSLRQVLEAEPEGLFHLGQLRLPAARMLGLMPQLSRYVMRERQQDVRRLNTFRAAAHYLASLYPGLPDEHFYLLCLDGEGGLLDTALMQRGTLNRAPFYPRTVLELVLRHKAQAVILSHNHPGGTPDFSPEDVNCTIAAVGLLSPLGVAVLDHIVVAGVNACSIRDCPHLPEDFFTRHYPASSLIREWLSEQEDTK